MRQKEKVSQQLGAWTKAKDHKEAKQYEKP